MLSSKLEDSVMHYLSLTNVLSGNPKYVINNSEMVCVDRKGEWEEYYMQPPYWQMRNVNVLPSMFENLQSLVSKTCYDEIQDNAIANIPNDKNTVIIEIGSEFGIKGCGYLAKFKDKANIFLLSKETDLLKGPFLPYLFNKNLKDKHRLIFENNPLELENESDISKKISGLYNANGISNVTFVPFELTLENTTKDKIPSFLKSSIGKDIYIFGHRSPSHLPYLTGNLYDSLSAKEVTISMTAPGRIPKDSFLWDVVRKQMKLNNVQLDGLISSTLDVPIDDGFSERYKYDNRELGNDEKRIGVSIKFLLAIALAKQIKGDVYRNTSLSSMGYNQIDYYVLSKRY